MAKTSNRGLGALLIRIALAAYFIITGLCMLGVGGSEMARQSHAAITEIFSGDLAKVIGIIIAVLLLVGGVCIVITIFSDLGSFDNTVMLILTVIWVAIAIIADVFSNSFGVKKLDGHTMFWILNVAKDLLIIGGLLSVR
ncbi:MAG: hypothetical protein J6X84_00060 [Treponema sp.]|nr:hypothetical protein [Treponema sp.]